MAQILKTSVKDQIVASATDELLKYGLKDSSMRRIAKNAECTVGNLYRYFKSKEEMIGFIIDPTFERINQSLRSLTNDGVVIGKDDIDVSILSNEHIIPILDRLSEDLVQIYEENKKIMKIVMMYSSVNVYVKEWFAKLIYKLFEKQNLIVNQADERKCLALANAYSTSIIEGVRECFMNNELTNEELTVVVKAYFRSFIAFMNMQEGAIK